MLLDLAASVGLPREEAEAVLSTRAFKDPVDEDWAISKARGITAVPTFVINQDKGGGVQGRYRCGSAFTGRFSMQFIHEQFKMDNYH